jgi:endonuclease/exonuclease/phosphatase family metal-dependent hydrolase
MFRSFIIAACFLLIIAFSPFVCPANAEASENLTAMTFNIRYGTANDGANAWPLRRDFLVETIKEYNPDVFGVQECLDFQAAWIKDHLKGYHWFGIGRDSDGGGESTAIFYRLSRLGPMGGGNFWLSEQPEKPGSRSWDAAHPRIVTWMDFHDYATGARFHVFNTHFDNKGATARQESARILAAKVRAIAPTGRVIVMGDFNCHAEKSPNWHTLTAEGLEDVWLTAKKRSGPPITATGFKPIDPSGQPRRIDWILSRGFEHVISAETVTKAKDARYPSDHFPIVAVFGTK